ncbi:hypothetical protein H4R99_007975 [Coemansia sp. RSA 1722]|nr:hypothetical protein LPJ57_003080 [Coemansia sp. RSA 486]KAJ2227199.1 hypothetical protein IWW45_007135 [Coemansia sp. RSA 485]KAJ2587944.1 hypothetical protein H4R99_007975 [Coemansia sp. RSA 1722]KAJ2637970.1 hypothetical protein GGF40_001993 [Coemansia sp. RSA 1286]
MAGVARRFTSAAAQSLEIKRVTVVGGGQMGAGIAQVSATFEHPVTLVDVNSEALDRGKQYMGKSLARVAKKKFPEDPKVAQEWAEDVLGRIQTTTSLADGVRNADLVIEAIVENIAVKQRLFGDIAADAPEECVLASNTSSLPIGKIAEQLDMGRRQKMVGLHFFNPVPQMKLVEVVKAVETSQEAVAKALAFVKSIGKAPAVCKDTPGFIVNRLLLPYMMEAIRLLERDVAEARDIDTAMKLGAGYPMGPFELCDYVGLDTIKFIVDGWYKEGEGLQGNKLFAASQKLDELVAAGHLGVKTGRGFYDYTKK